MASQHREEMANTLVNSFTGIQRNTAIERYIPYALSLFTSIKTQQVRLKKPIFYKWSSFLNGPKNKYECQQIAYGLFFSNYISIIVFFFLLPLEISVFFFLKKKNIYRTYYDSYCM